jgi:hypothetical protein
MQSNLSYYIDIYLEGLRKIMKHLSQVSDVKVMVMTLGEVSP